VFSLLVLLLNCLKVVLSYKYEQVDCGNLILISQRKCPTDEYCKIRYMSGMQIYCEVFEMRTITSL